MKRRRARLLQFLTTCAAVLGIFFPVPLDIPAWSQATRTIKIVVPSGPGGVNDILARLLAEQVGRSQGLTALVENRAGAGELIRTESVMRAAPDGNTLLIAANPFVINPQMRKVNYHPLTSFDPVCLLVTAPTLIVVNSASPYRTLDGLISGARAAPRRRDGREHRTRQPLPPWARSAQTRGES